MSLLAIHFYVVASSWILTFALHGVVVHAVALLARRTIVRSPRRRSTLWKAALILPFVSATIATAGWRPVGALGELRPAAIAARSPAGARHQLWVEQRVVRRAGLADRVNSFAVDSHGLGLARAAIALTLLAGLAGFGSFVRRCVRFRRCLGARTLLRAHAGYRLTASDSLGAPVALGLSEICVPPIAFAALTPGEQRSVLAHEAAHLARRDPLWFGVADLIVALAPWQPLVRAVVCELRRDAEFCCDDVVVHTLGDGRPLVQALVAFARGFDPAETALAASCGGSPLEERARRILAPRPDGRWSAAGLLGALLVMVAGAGFAAPAVSTQTRDFSRPTPGAAIDQQVIILKGDR